MAVLSRENPERKSMCVSHCHFTKAMWDALPNRAKNYIVDLETVCDHTGMVQKIASLTEQRDALVERVLELTTGKPENV